MEFGVLGELTAELDGSAVELGGARPRTVLAALLLRANETVLTGQLCDAVWDERPPAAESNLRTYVAKLRRGFGPEGHRLATTQGGYRLTVRPGEFDLETFAERAGRGRVALASGDNAEAARHLGEALRLWRGAALRELSLGPFLRADIAALDENRLLAQEQHVRARLELGRHRELVGELRTLTVANPLAEPFWELLMLALYRCGRQGDALAAFGEARAVLATDLGIEPGPRLRRLQQLILAGDPALAPARSVVSGISAHRQLPMDIAEFTGRENELRTLYRHAENAVGVPVVAAVEGMAGVGKTRFAVHAAHELVHRRQFDEIQLWADLRGFDPELSPVDPSRVLESFLSLLGVPKQLVPAGREDRSALYRDRLAGKKSLVLLDNVESADQVRPLLPGGATASLVLVTSRRALIGLDGVQQIRLSTPSTDDAVALLATIAGEERVTAEADQAKRITDLCGRLPLALALVARQLRNRPQWSLKGLADRLAVEGGQMNRLPGREMVRTTFDLSYRELSPESRRMFRGLGLHYGDECCVGASALLAGVGREQAEDLLDELVDENLVQESTPGRYRLHDLLRGYARECGSREDSPVEQNAAVRRLLAGYLHTTAAARLACDPHARPVPVDDIEVDRSMVPTFRTAGEGMAWYVLERFNLVASVRAAAERGHADIAWRLTLVLLTFFYLTKHWDDWVATHRWALDATTKAGDPTGQAHALNGLGVAYSDLHEWDESISCHRTAEELFARVGNTRDAAWNLNNVGVVHDNLGRFTEALRCYRAALALFREVGDRRGEGLALNNIGDVFRQREEFAEAVGYLRDALTVQDAAGDRDAKRFTLGTLGDLYQATGDHERAIVTYRDAVVISKAIDDRSRVASLLCRRADSLTAAGNPAAVRENLREALAIYTDLGDPQADAIGRRLDGSRT
ncbi:BTAD domain-containing putative transcriptional regulator [Actinophytocola sp. NPDC049390]|uniref:AfsR/SARP family transcriptional regulator n=1 Tax=Actinophytocola sp. NPDC049390 TaxID=3363894 RepID=UPI0037A9ED04